MRADLETLQQTFANGLLDTDGIEPALAVFKGNRDVNRQRFACYRGNIIAIWQQACAGAYPVIQQLVGEEFFNDLARVYGLTHGSQSGNLADFGAALPRLLTTLENCRDYPYLSDVAELEWRVHCAYFLEQTTPITLAQIATFSPDQFAELRFTLQKSCALFQSPWAVADIWHAHQHNAITLPTELSKPTYCLVSRPNGQADWRVQVNSLSPASYFALQALAEGQTLGQALELALAEDEEFNVQLELAGWFNKHLFNALVHPD